MSLLVSLIIGTRDRPELIKEALESVRRQTLRDRIGQIIVSEGGSTLASKKTCDLFPDLPIIYFDHRPPLSMAERIDKFWAPIEHPLVAILHDDDWWAPRHLEDALPLLESDPGCAAVYARWYESYGPEEPAVASDVAWLAWIAAGCDFRSSIVVLDDVSVLLGNLLNGSCHYSTLVGRREATHDAYLKMVAGANMFDNDRLFPINLSAFGSIGYVTTPNTFVRLHPGMDSMRPEHAPRMFTLIRDTTRWLLKTQPEKVARAVKRFNDAMSSLPLDQLPRLRQAIRDRVKEPQWTTLIEECGLNLSSCEEPATAAPAKAHDVRWFLKQCCPPLLLAIPRRLMRASTAS